MGSVIPSPQAFQHSGENSGSRGCLHWLNLLFCGSFSKFTRPKVSSVEQAILPATQEGGVNVTCNGNSESNPSQITAHVNFQTWTLKPNNSDLTRICKQLNECNKNHAPILSEDEEDVCPTCLEEYDAQNPKITAKCSHHFHLGCIYDWKERSDLCPVCMRVMEFEV